MRNTMPEDTDFAPYFRGFAESNEKNRDMLQVAYKLRYQVYCLEYKYLPADEYPDGRETDGHDRHSAHFYSRNDDDELVAYVRLVKAGDGGRFPWHEHCKDLYADVVLPPPELSVEISRLMVTQPYRRRRNDDLSGVNVQPESAGGFPGERRGESPQILLCLYRQMYQHCLLNGIRYWYAAMERPLARSLQRMNFIFCKLGPETDYFGPVAPYYMDLRQMESDVGKSNPELLAWLRRPDGNNG